MSDTPDKPNPKSKKRKRVNNLRRTKDGIPLITPKKHKNLAGRSEPPPTDGKYHLEKELKIDTAETLMIKGVTTYRGVADELGIDVNAAKRYMEAVEFRWALRGTGMRKVLLRGKARARLEVLSQELWEMYESATAEGTKMAALSRLMELHNQQMVVDGLTPQVLVQISATDNSHSEDTYEQTAHRFQKLSALAGDLAEYVDGSVVAEQ